MSKFITTSYEETQKLGKNFAKGFLESDLRKTAVVLGLSGNLGSGKTTFIQGFAKGLGIKEKILSPTFVIMKKFKIPQRTTHHSLQTTRYFYHIDCYRIKNAKDILELGFKEIIINPENIVAIEWPEHVKKILPKKAIKINFKFIDENKREITA